MSFLVWFGNRMCNGQVANATLGATEDKAERKIRRMQEKRDFEARQAARQAKLGDHSMVDINTSSSSTGDMHSVDLNGGWG